MAAGSKVKDGFVTRALLWWECSPEERRRTLIALAAGAVAGAIFGVVGCAVGRASGGILEMIKTPGSALTFAIFFVLAMVAMVAAVFVGRLRGVLTAPGSDDLGGDRALQPGDALHDRLWGQIDVHPAGDYLAGENGCALEQLGQSLFERSGLVLKRAFEPGGFGFVVGRNFDLSVDKV